MMYTINWQNEWKTVSSRLPAQDNFPPHINSTVPCQIATLGTNIQCFMVFENKKVSKWDKMKIYFLTSTDGISC